MDNLVNRRSRLGSAECCCSQLIDGPHLRAAHNAARSDGQCAVPAVRSCMPCVTCSTAAWPCCTVQSAALCRQAPSPAPLPSHCRTSSHVSHSSLPTHKRDHLLESVRACFACQHIVGAQIPIESGVGGVVRSDGGACESEVTKVTPDPSE